MNESFFDVTAALHGHVWSGDGCVCGWQFTDGIYHMRSDWKEHVLLALASREQLG